MYIDRQLIIINRMNNAISLILQQVMSPVSMTTLPKVSSLRGRRNRASKRHGVKKVGENERKRKSVRIRRDLSILLFPRPLLSLFPPLYAERLPQKKNPISAKD